MLRWPIRLASVIAAAVTAYGWGDFARDPSPAGVVALGLLTAILAIALVRLYRPGGMAAFQFEDGARLAPGEAVADAPAAPPAPPRARPQSGASLWSGEAVRPAHGPLGPARAEAGRVDLNAASVDELAAVPGIGRGAASRIVAHREAYGPFGSVSELAAVEGFDDARIDRVAGRVRV